MIKKLLFGLALLALPFCSSVHATDTQISQALSDSTGARNDGLLVIGSTNSALDIAAGLIQGVRHVNKFGAAPAGRLAAAAPLLRRPAGGPAGDRSAAALEQRQPFWPGRAHPAQAGHRRSCRSRRPHGCRATGGLRHAS